MRSTLTRITLRLDFIPVANIVLETEMSSRMRMILHVYKVHVFLHLMHRRSKLGIALKTLGQVQVGEVKDDRSSRTNLLD